MLTRGECRYNVYITRDGAGTKGNNVVITEVIESKHWKSSAGRTVSIYGALPYRTPEQRDAEGWQVVSAGWTVRLDDGTVGAGRPAMQTKDLAVAFALDHNARRISQLREHAARYPETAQECASKVARIEVHVRAICADAGIPADWASVDA